MLDVNEHNGSYPPAAQLAARDNFVAATAVKLEQLQAIVARVEREVDETRALYSELSEKAEQNHRFYAFQQNEKRMKELRLDELLRSCKEIKQRLDRIEGTDRPVVNFSETTFESVNKRITELAEKQNRIERAAHAVRMNALLLLGGILAALVAIFFRLV